MNILALSPHEKRIRSIFSDSKDSLIGCNEPIGVAKIECLGIDKIIVYGYHYPVDKEILSIFCQDIIEMHISYLPWNRGADPNFWSFFDETPKGVTLCGLDAGVDQIDIYAQRAVEFGSRETLATSYERLHNDVEDLLREHWPAIRIGALVPQRRLTAGKIHRRRDKDLFFSMLAKGWNTPVLAVEAMGRRFRGSPRAASSVPHFGQREESGR